MYKSSRIKARIPCLFVRMRKRQKIAYVLNQKKSGRFVVRTSRPTGVSLKYKKRGIAKFGLYDHNQVFYGPESF